MGKGGAAGSPSASHSLTASSSSGIASLVVGPILQDLARGPTAHQRRARHHPAQSTPPRSQPRMSAARDAPLLHALKPQGQTAPSRVRGWASIGCRERPLQPGGAFADDGCARTRSRRAHRPGASSLPRRRSPPARPAPLAGCQARPRAGRASAPDPARRSGGAASSASARNQAACRPRTASSSPLPPAAPGRTRGSSPACAKRGSLVGTSIARTRLWSTSAPRPREDVDRRGRSGHRRRGLQRRSRRRRRPSARKSACSSGGEQVVAPGDGVAHRALPGRRDRAGPPLSSRQAVAHLGQQRLRGEHRRRAPPPARWPAAARRGGGRSRPPRRRSPRRGRSAGARRARAATKRRDRVVLAQHRRRRAASPRRQRQRLDRQHLLAPTCERRAAGGQHLQRRAARRAGSRPARPAPARRCSQLSSSSSVCRGAQVPRRAAPAIG